MRGQLFECVTLAPENTERHFGAWPVKVKCSESPEALGQLGACWYFLREMAKSSEHTWQILSTFNKLRALKI